MKKFIRGDPAPKYSGAGETNSSGERNTPLLALNLTHKSKCNFLPGNALAAGG